MSSKSNKTAAAPAAPVDLSAYRWVAFGHTWGIIAPVDIANAAITAGMAITPGSKDDPATKVQAVKGLYVGKDGQIWTGKGGTDQGKRFLTFPTKGDLAKAAAAAAAPTPVLAPKAAPAAAAAPAAPAAPAASRDLIIAEFRQAGFSVTEIMAALKEMGLL